MREAGHSGGTVGVCFKQNPENALVWYELAFAQTAKQQWRDCITSAQMGLTFASHVRTSLFQGLANCQDASGDAPAALETYGRALASLPVGHDPKQKAMLHFNLGIAYFGQTEIAKARENFQMAVRLNPRHASSHVQLANAYLRTDDRIPALLALGVFLTLEPPTSPRVPGVVDAVRRILGAGVSRTGSKSISITVQAGNKDNPEGDFSPELMMLGLSGAADLMGDKKRKKQTSEFSRLESHWSSLLETMLRPDRLEKLGNTFVAQNYFSFYRGIKESKLTGAFVSHIFQSATLPSSREEKKALEMAPNFQRWAASWPEH